MAAKRKLFQALQSLRVNKCYSTHTWSPLAMVFNSKVTYKINFNLIKENKGLFDVPELRTHEGFYALKESCIYQTDRLVAEALSSDRKRKMVTVFDELSDTLCKVADLAEFIRLAHPNAVYSKAAEIACITVSGIVEKLNTNNMLYKALKDVVQKGDIVETSEIDNHVANLFLFDFEQSGIHLPDTERRQVVKLNNAILHLGQHFMNGASKPRIVQKSVLPENVEHFFNISGNKYHVHGLYADSSDPTVREFAYRIYLQPDMHQEDLLIDLLTCRHQLAQVCGFEAYSDRALKSSLAETPEMVCEFLDELSEGLRSRATDDFETMKKLKEAELGSCAGPLAIWDVPYFNQKAKKDIFQVTSNEYMPYFSLGTCMEGLNTLFTILYNVSLVNTELSVGETWVSSIYKLAVVHGDEGLLGYIYCDFYERSGKPNQDCHFTIRGGKELFNGEYQLPVVVLMLNLTAPRWSEPALLSPNMVDNLFHEMGHAMHSMLARTRYQHVTGTRCSTDFAEVPSVLMEYFANDPRVLSTFARHFQTGEPMPEDMMQRLCASKHLFAASEMQQQVFYSVLDQKYHGHTPLSGSSSELLAQIQEKYSGLPHVPDTAWQLRFSHLVGYGAKYYSYLMSRAVASWIWQAYFQEDPLNSTQGDRYRRECLAYGGGKPPRQLVGDFLQRTVTAAELAKSLITEIDSKNEYLTRVIQHRKSS